MNGIGSADGIARGVQLERGPDVHGKIIDFEFAKCALDQVRRPELRRSACLGIWRPLPNLAAEDWFDWAALAVMFGGVALFPFLAMVLLR